MIVMLYIVSVTQKRPFFWVAVLFEILGALFIMFGFIAELIVNLEEQLENRALFQQTVAKWWEDIS